MFEFRERAKQLISFDGLLDEGKLSATDIDGFIEYKDLCYIFIEVKGKGKELPFGQNLALKRLADDLSKVKPTVILVVEHQVENPEEDILIKDTVVRTYRYKGIWLTPPDSTTTKEAVTYFIKGVVSGKIKTGVLNGIPV